MFMRRFTTFAAGAALLMAILPGLASAHGNNAEAREHDRVRSGTVTAVSTSGFTLKARDGTVFTVNVTSDTKLTLVGTGAIKLSDITVNANALVTGKVDGTAITAKVVVVTPANTHPATAKGTVTAVAGTSFSLQTNNHGVISNVTVNTDANTKIQKSSSTSTATMADVTVGAVVKVRGLWDEILNVLNAIKIRIK